MWQLRLPCVVRAITEKGIEVEPWRKLRCASTTFSSLLVEDLGSTEIPNDVNMPERVQGPMGAWPQSLCFTSHAMTQLGPFMTSW